MILDHFHDILTKCGLVFSPKALIPNVLNPIIIVRIIWVIDQESFENVRVIPLGRVDK